MSKIIKSCRPRAPREFKLMTFRATLKEVQLIKKLADKWAGGNQTQWLKYAALNFKPGKTDLIDD